MRTAAAAAVAPALARATRERVMSGVKARLGRARRPLDLGVRRRGERSRGRKNETPRCVCNGAFLMRCRRRPTLPRPLGRSTIGAVGLNDRVRDGNGCGPYALVASEVWSFDFHSNTICGGTWWCGAIHV